jgi:AcrR family transcriptional regulator
VLQHVNPALSDAQMVLRAAAVQGVLLGLAMKGTKVSRPRLDDMIVASTLAIYRSGASTVPANAGRTVWRPTPTRREVILAEALRMFRERNFHNVGVNEIGEAVGMSGPSLYRHYRNKLDILQDAFEKEGQRIAAAMHQALGGASSAVDALRRMCECYTEVAIDDVDLIVVTGREDPSVLPDGAGGQRRARSDMEEMWCRILTEVRPDLHRDELSLLVTTTFSLINQAVEIAEADPERGGEIAAMAFSHLMSERVFASAG